MGPGIVVRLGYLRSWIMTAIAMDGDLLGFIPPVRYAALYLTLMRRVSRVL
jgi:hypothetical protein